MQRNPISPKLLDEAAQLGAEHGKSAGAWVIDGNTSEETKLLALKLDEDGDPEFYDRFGTPDPLSGEWADGLTPDGLLRELGLSPEFVEDWQSAEICNAYEESFRDSHRDEVLRSASATLSSR